MKYKKELQAAKKAAKQAGSFLMEKFRKPQQNKISFKKKREIVTEADIGAEKIIEKNILNFFPKANILGEEIKRPKKKNDYLWLIDPLDGTNNFAHGLPVFAVCIALAHKKDIKAGVVYLPYYKEMFWAIKGEGAFLNGKKIKLSEIAKLKDAFVLQCYRSDAKNRRKYLKIIKNLAGKIYTTRHLGAAGYEMASVARGHASAGYIVGVRPWDVAPGALIIRELGGIVSDFKGSDWQLDDENILFSNKKIHKKLLNLINK